MDPLDELIKQPEPGPLPDGLHRRVLENFRRRRRGYQRLQAIEIGGSAVLMLLGAWLFGPFLLWLAGEIPLPQTGIPALQTAAALLDTGPAAMRTIQNAAYLQSNLSQSASLLDALGLLALAAGAAIALSLLMRRRLW